MRPCLNVLAPALVERIIDEALSVLEKRGVLIEDETCFRAVVDSGLPGNAETKRVMFPRATVEQALKDAPSGITLYDRDGQPHADLSGDNVHFVPGSSALRILDRRSDQPRSAVTADFIEYVKVCNQLEHIAYPSTAFVTKDVPPEMADAWRLYLTLAYSKKPVVTGAFTSCGVQRMATMMGFFRRDADQLREKPMAIFTCCPNTPLRWGEISIHNMIDCAKAGIPIEIVPVLLLGMIAPATIVGALVLHTAEVISGLTIAQLQRTGTPVLFGGAPAAFHMQLMTNPMTAVEALQVLAGYAQIAKYLELPCQGYMGLSDGKFNDMQAGSDTGVGLFLAALAGMNSVSGPGMLDYVNCFSLEKLVFDDELAAHAHRFTRPIEIKDDLPTQPLIDELLAENHLLTSEHTLAHWPKELYLPGPMIDRTNWDQFKERGSKRCKARALDAIEEALVNYDVEPLDAACHREIRRLFATTCEEHGATLPELA